MAEQRMKTRLRWFEIEVTGLGYRPMRELMRATTGSAARKAAQAKYGSSAVVALVGRHEQRLMLNRSSPDPRRRSITTAHQQTTAPAPDWRPPTGSNAFSNLQASN